MRRADMAEFLDYDISAYPFSGFQIFWNVSSSIKRNLAIFGYIFTGFAMFKFGIWFINLKNVHVTHISFNTIDINLFLHLQKHCMKSVQIQSYFWSEYKKIRTRNNSVFGHFSRSESQIYFGKGLQSRFNNHSLSITHLLNNDPFAEYHQNFNQLSSFVSV